MTSDLEILKYTIDSKAFIEDILNLEVKDFHNEWINSFESHNFVSLLAPRGHGKTTIVGSYIIWRIIKNPDIRILIEDAHYKQTGGIGYDKI